MGRNNCYGFNTSMLPEAFFSRRVKSIGGIKVTNPDKLLDILAQAGSGYHFYGKSAERLVIRRNLIKETKGHFSTGSLTESS